MGADNTDFTVITDCAESLSQKQYISDDELCIVSLLWTEDSDPERFHSI